MKLSFQDILPMLDKPDAPFVMSLIGGKAPLIKYEICNYFGRKGLFLIDGRDLCHLDQMHKIFSLKFEYDFRIGENWSSFTDTMTDLSWLDPKKILIFIDHAEGLLPGKIKERKKFLDVLSWVGSVWATPVNDGEWWDRGAIPFHVLFHSDKRPLGFDCPYAEMSQPG